ncbi:MAG: hypothetical protein DRN12_03010 [Thermoplasmata archaeon]|nr:MAG: hypothetical protein DRN12_03010 [Thermoplasmata archaeon]
MIKSKGKSEEIKEKVGRYGIKPILVLLLFLNIVFLIFSANRILKGISVLQYITWLILVLSIIAIPVISYGFLKRKKWGLAYALLVSIIYTIISIVFLVNTGNIILWYPLFILSFISLISLFLSSTRRHFKPIAKKFEEKRVEIEEELLEETEEMETEERETAEEVYKHGEFTLYKKLVPTKSGSSRVFYFFSRESSDKGIPCPLPEGYEVHINKKSGVPYLKKKKER